MDLVYLTERELKRRKYSPNTIESYCFCLKKFLLWWKKDPKNARKSDIRAFLFVLADKDKSASTLNIYLQAIKFAFENILGRRNMFVDLPYAKKSKKLPEFLTQAEVKEFLNCIDNEKHFLLIALMYGAGLRVSEVVSLKSVDLDLMNNYGWVRGGKGNKDRPFVIPEVLRNRLKLFCGDKRGFIFLGQKGHLSQRTVAEIVKRASCKACLNKKVHPHTLRHSFATHMIENGEDLIKVQPLLGHSQIDTTMVYVHLARPKLLNVRSPLDQNL